MAEPSRVQRLAAMVRVGSLGQPLPTASPRRDEDGMHACIIALCVRNAAAEYKTTVGRGSPKPFHAAFAVFAVDAATHEAVEIDPLAVAPCYARMRLMSGSHCMNRDLRLDVRDAMRHPAAQDAACIPFLRSEPAHLTLLAVRRVILEYVCERKHCGAAAVPRRLYQLMRHHMPGGLAEEDTYAAYLGTHTVVTLLHRDTHGYAPKVCARCGAACKKMCVACAAPYYCGRECQAAHWRAVHKAECAGLAMAVCAQLDRALMTRLLQL